MTEFDVLDKIVQAAAALGWSPSPEAEETGPYAILGELAQRLVACVHDDDTVHFPNLFDTVETSLSNASPESRDLVIVGFLEDLQNTSLNSGLSLAAWTPWFGANTREAWDTLEAAWSGRLSPPQFNDAINARPSRPNDTPA